jgi:hypothetical protein
MEYFMNTNVKSFLESLDMQEEVNEQKLFKKNQARCFNTKMPKAFFEHPIYQPINEIIFSQNPLYIVPRRWEELDRDFENIAVRNYLTCQQSVLKVSNLHNYQNGIKRYDYIAIPFFSPLYNTLYQTYKFQMDIYIFIQIVRMIVQGSGYRESSDIHSCEVQKVLDVLLSKLVEYSYIDHKKLLIQCRNFSINIFELLSEIDSFYQNDSLNKHIILLKKILKEHHVNK